MQAEGVGEAYRTWRRQWKGTGREYVSLDPLAFSHDSVRGCPRLAVERLLAGHELGACRLLCEWRVTISLTPSIVPNLHILR